MIYITLGEECEEYLKTWIMDRKLTTRVEDIHPSSWFHDKTKAWEKANREWNGKLNSYKAPFCVAFSDKGVLFYL